MVLRIEQTGGSAPTEAFDGTQVADQPNRLALVDDIGQHAFQTDTGGLWEQIASPATNPANWIQLNAGGAPTSAYNVINTANTAARLALADDVGQHTVQTDDGSVWIQTASPATSAANWVQLNEEAPFHNHSFFNAPGNLIGAVPLSPAATPLDGDFHLEAYDDGAVWWVHVTATNQWLQACRMLFTNGGSYTDVANSSARTSLPDNTGQTAHQLDDGSLWVQTVSPATLAGNWTLINDGSAPHTQVADQTARLTIADNVGQHVRQADDGTLWVQIATPGTLTVSWEQVNVEAEEVVHTFHNALASTMPAVPIVPPAAPAQGDLHHESYIDGAITWQFNEATTGPVIPAFWLPISRQVYPSISANTHTVADVTERDALTGLADGDIIHVADDSPDHVGWARYQVTSTIAGTTWALANETLIATEQGDVFIGSTFLANGAVGLVPQPLVGQHELYLKGDGTWANPANASFFLTALQATANGISSTAPTVVEFNASALSVLDRFVYVNGTNVANPDTATHVFFQDTDGTWLLIRSPEDKHQGEFSQINVDFTATPSADQHHFTYRYAGVGDAVATVEDFALTAAESTVTRIMNQSAVGVVTIDATALTGAGTAYVGPATVKPGASVEIHHQGSGTRVVAYRVDVPLEDISEVDLFLTETLVAPASPGRPTLAEVQAAAGPDHKHAHVSYNGTDAEAGNIPTHIWFVDRNGAWLEINTPDTVMFAPSTAVSPGFFEHPTAAELKAWGAAQTPPVINSHIRYTGTDTITDDDVALYYIDSHGEAVVVHQLGLGVWRHELTIALGTPTSKRVAYVALDLPGAVDGDRFGVFDVTFGAGLMKSYTLNLIAGATAGVPQSVLPYSVAGNAADPLSDVELYVSLDGTECKFALINTGSQAITIPLEFTIIPRDRPLSDFVAQTDPPQEDLLTAAVDSLPRMDRQFYLSPHVILLPPVADATARDALTDLEFGDLVSTDDTGEIWAWAGDVTGWVIRVNGSSGMTYMGVNQVWSGAGHYHFNGAVSQLFALPASVGDNSLTMITADTRGGVIVSLAAAGEDFAGQNNDITDTVRLHRGVTQFVDTVDGWTVAQDQNQLTDNTVPSQLSWAIPGNTVRNGVFQANNNTTGDLNLGGLTQAVRGAVHHVELHNNDVINRTWTFGNDFKRPNGVDQMEPVTLAAGESAHYALISIGGGLNGFDAIVLGGQDRDSMFLPPVATNVERDALVATSIVGDRVETLDTATIWEFRAGVWVEVYTPSSADFSVLARTTVTPSSAANVTKLSGGGVLSYDITANVGNNDSIISEFTTFRTVGDRAEVSFTMKWDQDAEMVFEFAASLIPGTILHSTIDGVDAPADTAGHGVFALTGETRQIRVNRTDTVSIDLHMKVTMFCDGFPLIEQPASVMGTFLIPVPDAVSRDAVTATTGDRVETLDDGKVWRWDGAAWLEVYTPLAASGSFWYDPLDTVAELALLAVPDGSFVETLDTHQVWMNDGGWVVVYDPQLKPRGSLTGFAFVEGGVTHLDATAGDFDITARASTGSQAISVLSVKYTAMGATELDAAVSLTGGGRNAQSVQRWQHLQFDTSATISSIDAVLNNSSGTTTQIRVRVYAGAGIGGAVLADNTETVTVDASSDGTTTQLTFPPIAILANTDYTISIVRVAGTGTLAWVAYGPFGWSTLYSTDAGAGQAYGFIIPLSGSVQTVTRPTFNVAAGENLNGVLNGSLALDAGTWLVVDTPEGWTVAGIDNDNPTTMPYVLDLTTTDWTATGPDWYIEVTSAAHGKLIPALASLYEDTGGGNYDLTIPSSVSINRNTGLVTITSNTQINGQIVIQ